MEVIAVTKTARFADHFSSVAEGYRRARPGYPESLIRYLSEIAPPGARVLDCATGSGQLAGLLRPVFPDLVACDASLDQLLHCPADGIQRVLCRAEALPFPDASVGLMTVAQAVHWFDLAGFGAEVSRVLSQDGVLALIGYGLFDTECAELNALVRDYYSDTLGEFWPDERRWIDQAYEGLPLELPLLHTRTFEYRQVWSVKRLVAYLETWSATRRLTAAGGRSQFDQLACSMLEIEESREVPEFEVIWPVFTRVFSGGRSRARSRGE